MAFRFRHILTIFSVIAVLGIGLLGLFFWLIFSALERADKFVDLPEEIQEARVLSGEGLLSREEFFKLKTQSFLGIIFQSITETDEVKQQQRAQSEMAKKMSGFDACFYDAANNEVVFAGMFGAEVLDRSGAVKREILFQPVANKFKAGWFESKNYGAAFSEVRIADLDKDGSYEFVGSGGAGGLAVFDKEGNGLWRYGQLNFDMVELLDKEKIEESRGKYFFINAVTTGDLDGDGTEEVVVTTSNNEIIAFDNKGHEKWRRQDDRPGSRLQILDVDGDEKAEIFEWFYMMSKIRDSEGNLIKQSKKEDVGYENVFVTEDGKKKKLNFVKATSNKLTVTDEGGKIVWEGDAPYREVKWGKNSTGFKPAGAGGKDIDPAEGTMSARAAEIVLVKLKSGQAKYLAMVASYIGSNRAVFYVYSPEGDLVYNEILPEESKTIMALPGADGETEDVLVGGKKTIWRYRAK